MLRVTSPLFALVLSLILSAAVACGGDDDRAALLPRDAPPSVPPGGPRWNPSGS